MLAGEVGALDLIAAFQRVLARLEKQKGAEREIESDRFTVSEKIEYVLKILPEREGLRFEELFAGQTTRSEVVATFLALLELVRLRHVHVEQEGAFGDIMLRRRGLAVVPELGAFSRLMRGAKWQMLRALFYEPTCPRS